MPRPSATDYYVFYNNYVETAKGDSVAELLINYSALLNDFVTNLPEAKADYSYAAGKWTVKELLQHMIDAERIFSYRALRIARKDTTPLPGFDENSYAANADVSSKTFQSLKEEFVAVRQSTDLLLQSFSEEQLQQVGTTSNHSITVNAICFIIFGHILHHKRILEERYL
ncbi:MAG: DNA damage-inducible protein DinB [Chitinophaga sp.]|jgi:uncharacterized damage-inducible protein DinB|nr:DNA damage-inducible protein DinB [Chitinophaga sp.]